VRKRIEPMLIVADGEITQKRLKKEIERALKRSEAQSHNALKSWKSPKRFRSNENNEVPPARASADGDAKTDADTSPRDVPTQCTQAHNHITPPVPPSVVDAEWETFRERWPTKSDLTIRASVLFKNLKPDDRKAAVVAIGPYLSEMRKLDRPLSSARTYLEQQMWQGFHDRPLPETVGRQKQAPPGVSIWPGTAEWKAWRSHFEAALKLDPKNKEAIEALATMRAAKRTEDRFVCPLRCRRQFQDC
jgi:hypothetical protein